MASNCIKFRIIKSPRGGEVLLYAGHQYRKTKTHKNSSWWRCSNRCSGSVTLNFNKTEIIRETKHDDSCIPNKEKNEVKITISKCKNKICQDLKPIPTIYNEETSHLQDQGYEIIDALPHYYKIKTSLYRHRNKYLGITKTLCTDPTQVEIPNIFKENLLFDYNENGNRIIVFGSKSVMENIKENRHFFADGTFKCCPKPFFQLYVIYADIGSTDTGTNIVPAFYALLCNKEETTYETLFYTIKIYIPDWQPEIITVDYEQAPINAIKKIFSNIVVKGCYVHFARALLRKAKGLGLLQNNESHNHVKLCMALAHLPKKDISEDWLHIMTQNEAKYTNFNDYFVDYWLENEEMINIWCCFERHRTTNLMESWNSRFNRKLGKKPKIPLFCRTIVEDIKYYENKQKRFYENGENICSRRKKYIQNDCYIRKLLDEFENKNISLEDCLLKLSQITYITL